MAKQYVLPVVNTALSGDTFALEAFADVFYVFFGPRDLGAVDARGLSGASSDEATQATIRIAQALIALSRLAASWERGTTVSPSVFGVARVPCRHEGQTSYGVLFVCVFNSRSSVQNIRVQCGVVGLAGDEDADAAAPARRGRPPGPRRFDPVNDEPKNMAEFLHQLSSAKDAGRKRGDASRVCDLEVTDNHIMALGTRAFPLEHFDRHHDRSGFCTNTYQLNSESALSLTRVLGLDATLGLLAAAHAAPVFLNRGNYEGHGGGIFLSPALRFQQLLTARIDPKNFPQMVFPWKWVPGPGVAQEIVELVQRELEAKSADDRAQWEGRTESERRTWALQELLNRKELLASDSVNDFRGLREAAQIRCNAVRADAIRQCNEHESYRWTGDAVEDRKRVYMRNAACMRRHHATLETELFPSLAQLLDPTNNAFRHIQVGALVGRTSR